MVFVFLGYVNCAAIHVSTISKEPLVQYICITSAGFMDLEF